jgi:hypothetical protein
VIFHQGQLTTAQYIKDGFADLAKKYTLNVTVGLNERQDYLSFQRERMVTFTIEDAPWVEEPFLSHKNRVRGFLKELADVLTEVATVHNLGIRVASTSGPRRDQEYKNRVRQIIDEMERDIMYVDVPEPLSFAELWEEYQNCPATMKPRVIVAFRESIR